MLKELSRSVFLIRNADKWNNFLNKPSKKQSVRETTTTGIGPGTHFPNYPVRHSISIFNRHRPKLSQTPFKPTISNQSSKFGSIAMPIPEPTLCIDQIIVLVSAPKYQNTSTLYDLMKDK